MALIVPAFLLMIVVTSSVPSSIGYTIINGNDYDDYYDTTSSVSHSNDTVYNDTLLENVLDSPYVSAHNKNWRYSFSDNMDTDNNGVLSEEEIEQKLKRTMELVFKMLDKDNNGLINKVEVSSFAVDTDEVYELASNVLDFYPDRYYWVYYSFWRRTDQNKDGFLTLDEIEEPLQINNEVQRQIIKELFNYFDNDKDNKLSLDDFKPHLKHLISMVFKIFDQNNDDFISIDDLDDVINIQWNDITSILDLLKQEYMKNGQIDMNYLLVPFNLDLNEDGIMNTLDLYLGTSWSYGGPDSSILLISKVIRAIDQDQDGVYTFDELKQFVAAVWNTLDADNDMSITMEDGYALLQDKFNVDVSKITAAKGYATYVTTYLKREFLKLVDFLIDTIDRDEDTEVSLEELYQMPEPCFYSWRDETCFQAGSFPELDRNVYENFFPDINRRYPIYINIPQYRQWDVRIMAFVHATLDSPKFYTIREFDSSAAEQTVAKIENLVPQGEELLNGLRHKISAYKQIVSYLDKQV